MAFISFNLEYLVDPIWDIGFESNSDQKEEKPTGQAERKPPSPTSFSLGLDMTLMDLMVLNTEV